MKSEIRFTRGAWLNLGLTALLIGGATLLLAYRFSLPTDGWNVASPGDQSTSSSLIYVSNIEGASSQLRPGDRLIAVGGLPLDQLNAAAVPSLGWFVGNSVPYTIIRAEQHLTVSVPIVHWTYRNWWSYGLVQSIGMLIGSIFFGVGLFTGLRRPGDEAAQALLILGACFFAVLIDTLLPGGGGTHGLAESLNPIASISESILVVGIYGLLLPATWVRFGLFFPKRKPVVARHPWLARLPYLAGLAVLLSSALPLLGDLSLVWIIASVLLTILLLGHSALTMRDVVSRAQMRWGVGGMLLGLGVFSLIFLSDLGWVSGPLAAVLSNVAGLGIAIMGLSLTVAILRYRLFDIDVIIRRTLIYLVLTVVLALVYFGAVLVFQTVGAALTGQRQTELVTVLSTLFIAALFNPLRKSIQAVIDRRFYRRKYDAARTLAQFGATLRDDANANLDDLTERLITVVVESMQPTSVSLWLKDRDDGPAIRK